MLDGVDYAFASALERWLLREVNGDNDKYPGLLRSMLGAQDWDTINRAKGMILAYEQVLKAMRDIAQQMNEPHEQAPHMMGRPH